MQAKVFTRAAATWRSFASAIVIASIFASVIALASGSVSEADEQLLSTTSQSEAKGHSIVDSTWIKSSPRHSKFTLFTESGQSDPIIETTGHGTIRAIAGTVLGTDGLPMVLNGCVKVACDKGKISIGTRMFSVTIPLGAQAIVESFPSIHSFRVVALPSSGNSPVIVNSKQARLPVRLGSGEMLATEDGSLGSAMKYDQSSFCLLTPEAQSLINSAEANSLPCRITTIEATHFKCTSAGAVAISEGECLISAGSGLTVLGPTAETIAKQNALIDVEAYAGNFRVKALSGPGHVSILEGDQSLPLHPGQEIMITKRKIDDSDKKPPDGIGRRFIEELKLKDGARAIMSDYSIMSFLAAEHLLQLRRSADPKDQNIINRILKTAAAIQSLTASRGNYTASPRVSRRIRKESGPRA